MREARAAREPPRELRECESAPPRSREGAHRMIRMSTEHVMCVTYFFRLTPRHSRY